jgi:uncharacterized protein YndB with AHSA1/START domain
MTAVENKLVSTFVEPDTVKMERLLPGPPERIWAYLTESDKRATWLAAGEFDLRVGGKVRLDFDNSKLPNDEEGLAKHPGTGVHTFEGTITRLEPNRVLAYTWLWGDNETDVTYELTPKGKDVLLTIVHRRLKPREVAQSVTAGWDVHTGILADVLNDVPPRPFWTTHDRLQAEYAARA